MRSERIHRRGQLATIAWLRWRLFVNSLRSRRGKLELASRIIVSVVFGLGAIGGAVGTGAGAWYCVSSGKPEFLALLLWPVFFFWQAFPLMATAFTNNPDSSDLLRFPLTYQSYFLVRLAYGSFDPATALGSTWCVAITIGIAIAKPVLLPWSVLVMLTFAAFNALFMQTVFAWVERWLAQRRTREIMGVLFFLVMLSFQFIGPAMERFRPQAHPELQRVVTILAPVQAILPPGLAADAIARVATGQPGVGLTSFVLLCAFVLLIAYFLNLRLRAQYRGENLSEAAARRSVEKTNVRQLGWTVPGFSLQVAAVFEKEIRYLMRSGPMLLTLIMPIFVLVVFRLGPMNPTRRSASFLAHGPDMAFPAAVGYTLLILTNLVYNSFGADAGGIQFFYASPVQFSEVVLGKNLTHAGVLVLEIFLAWFAVTLLYGPPRFDVAVASLAGLLFAAPVNFTVGNLMSLYSPKKLDYATFGRQRATQLTVLISMGVQIVVVGLGVTAFVVARLYRNFWIATAIFFVLAVISFAGYVLVLRRLDQIALERRETLVAELCRA